MILIGKKPNLSMDLWYFNVCVYKEIDFDDLLFVCSGVLKTYNSLDFNNN